MEEKKTIERIPHLIRMYITHTINQDEMDELNAWRKASESNEKTFGRLTDMEFLQSEYRRRQAISSEKAMQDMQFRLGLEDKEKRSFALWRWVAAAVILLIFVGGAAVMFQRTILSSDENTVALNEKKSSTIEPGETKATLTINGKTMALDADTARYSNLVASVMEKEADISQLNLETPRGGEYKVTLEDGSEVWLNAASKLIYPQTFGTEERRVKITGEAYFKVKRDETRPFLVETAGQVVQVYGTEFNVHSYSEDAKVYTTLVSGSISQRPLANNGGEVVLTPGHQIVYDKAQGSSNVRSVATDVVTSWRNGTFVFEDQTLEQIFVTLSRWYDFDYRFSSDKLRNMVFMGSVPRYAEFKTVLAILESCGGVKFVQKGRVVEIQSAK